MGDSEVVSADIIGGINAEPKPMYPIAPGATLELPSTIQVPLETSPTIPQSNRWAEPAAVKPISTDEKVPVKKDKFDSESTQMPATSFSNRAVKFGSNNYVNLLVVVVYATALEVFLNATPIGEVFASDGMWASWFFLFLYVPICLFNLTTWMFHAVEQASGVALGAGFYWFFLSALIATFICSELVLYHAWYWPAPLGSMIAFNPPAMMMVVLPYMRVRQMFKKSQLEASKRERVLQAIKGSVMQFMVFMMAFMICLLYLFFVKTVAGQAWYLQVIAISVFEAMVVIFQTITAKLHAWLCSRTDMEPHSKHWFMGVTCLMEIYGALVISQLHPSGFIAMILTACARQTITVIILPYRDLKAAEKLQTEAATAAKNGAVMQEVVGHGGDARGSESSPAASAALPAVGDHENRHANFVASPASRRRSQAGVLEPMTVAESSTNRKFEEDSVSAEFFMATFAQIVCLLFYNLFLALVVYGPNKNNYNFVIDEEGFFQSCWYSAVLLGILLFYLGLSSVLCKRRFGFYPMPRGLGLFFGKDGKHVWLRVLEIATPVLMGFKFMLKQSNADIFSLL